MDLIDIFEDTNRLLQALRSEGGIYLPINFDGTTYFEPRYSEGRNAVDELIESRFHELMGPESCTDEKYYPRSCTGRRLLGIFTENSSLSLQSFGSSAWCIHPRSSGIPKATDAYLRRFLNRLTLTSNLASSGLDEDEKYFLHCILSFIEHTVGRDDRVDKDIFQRYIAERRKQCDLGQLSYLAHNMDYFGLKR